MNGVISFEQQRGIYIVNGSFRKTFVSICIKVGCDQESPGQNGLSHLVEHICLAYRHSISSFYNRHSSFIDLGFQFSGYTNYGQSVLNVSFPNSLQNLGEFSTLLEGILDASVVNENTFEISKNEVLSECQEFAKQWEWQIQVIQFITNNQMHVLPVGKVEDINQLNLQDAISFIRDYYTFANLVCIIQTSLSASVVEKAIMPILQKANKDNMKYHGKVNKAIYHSGNEVTVETLCLKNATDQMIVEIYFQRHYEQVDLKRKVVRMLFEVMTGATINEYTRTSPFHDMYLNCSVSDKHITDFFYFTVFTLSFKDVDDTLTCCAEEIVRILERHTFSENEFIAAKSVIENFLAESELSDREDIFENLSANFFYGEPIHITSEHYIQVNTILDAIEIHDVAMYKNWALRAPCKIVIST